jgi:bacteriophage N4 adsorption protein B
VWIELLDTYLLVLKTLAVGVAVLLLVSGLDDLIIDITYWVRRAWRAVTVYRHHHRLTASALAHPPEKPLAIMVPAWHESGVIGRMAELAATTIDYENYHVFVGTYPNDPDTQRDVDEVCARFRNVHKVICARPGPTSKADCLNNVLDAILQFERRANLQFAGYILHDAEDVISPLELRLFNYLVDRKDLIQLPVYPFARRWSHFTSGHYMDEFAELHGKEIPVREALAGQVPSAGVGTCFSRRAVLALLGDGDGVAFDVQSLTEDYDIGIRLRARGMTEIFVRFPVVTTSAEEPAGRRGAASDASHVICVREYFPDTFSTAVRQKSRWIVGIVFQGLKTHGWTRDLALNYFLWRDRKGAISNFVGFTATLIFLQALLLWAYATWAQDPRPLEAIFDGERWFAILLGTNFVLMVNRIGHRMYFVSRSYGAREAVLSVARLFWGGFINFAANWRAIAQILAHGDARRVAWDKTAHEFPMLGEAPRARRALGRILVDHGAITEAQLERALAARTRGLKLGSSLVHQNVITPEQLAAAVAEQCGVTWEPVDPLATPRELLRELPEELALHYAVLPLREEGRTLVLGSESYVDPVSLSAIARKLDRPVRYVIVPTGRVTVGLRRWYVRARTVENPRALLDEAVEAGRLTAADAERVWQRFVSRQVLFAEVLLSLGHLDPAALSSVLVRHERSSLSLGEYLVLHGIVSPGVLKEALAVQSQVQGSMEASLAGHPDVVNAPKPTLAWERKAV